MKNKDIVQQLIEMRDEHWEDSLYCDKYVDYMLDDNDFRRVLKKKKEYSTLRDRTKLIEYLIKYFKEECQKEE